MVCHQKFTLYPSHSPKGTNAALGVRVQRGGRASWAHGDSRDGQDRTFQAGLVPPPQLGSRAVLGMGHLPGDRLRHQPVADLAHWGPWLGRAGQGRTGGWRLRSYSTTGAGAEWGPGSQTGWGKPQGWAGTLVPSGPGHCLV